MLYLVVEMGRRRVNRRNCLWRMPERAGWCGFRRAEGEPPDAWFEGRPIGVGWARGLGWTIAAIWGDELWTAVGGVGNGAFSSGAMVSGPVSGMERLEPGVIGSGLAADVVVVAGTAFALLDGGAAFVMGGDGGLITASE